MQTCFLWNGICRLLQVQPLSQKHPHYRFHRSHRLTLQVWCSRCNNLDALQHKDQCRLACPIGHRSNNSNPLEVRWWCVAKLFHLRHRKFVSSVKEPPKHETLIFKLDRNFNWDKEWNAPIWETNCAIDHFWIWTLSEQRSGCHEEPE